MVFINFQRRELFFCFLTFNLSARFLLLSKAGNKPAYLKVKGVENNEKIHNAFIIAWFDGFRSVFGTGGNK